MAKPIPIVRLPTRQKRNVICTPTKAVDDVDEKIDVVQEDVHNVQDELSAVHGEVTSMQDDVTSIKEAQDDNSAKIDYTARGIHALCGVVSELLKNASQTPAIANLQNFTLIGTKTALPLCWGKVCFPVEG